MRAAAAAVRCGRLRHACVVPQRIWATLQSSAGIHRAYFKRPLHTTSEVSLSAAATASTPPKRPSAVIVNAFKDLANPTKRFILRVHPDVVHSHGEEVVATNEESLQEFFRLFECLRLRCEHAENKTAGSANIPASKLGGLLKPRYELTFFYRSLVAESTTNIQRCAVEVTLPPSFDERMKVLLARGLFEQAKAHYLNLGVSSLDKLLKAVGVETRVELEESLARIVANSHANPGTARDRKASSPGALAGAAEALRANLLHSSPIVQGKGGSAAALHVSMESGAFSPQERKQRALKILSRTDYVAPMAGLTQAQSRIAMAKLYSTFTEFHDRLQLFESIWLALHIRIGKNYYADPSGVLYIPYDFDALAFVSFALKHLPDFISRARKSADSKKASATNK